MKTMLAALMLLALGACATAPDGKPGPDAGEIALQLLIAIPSVLMLP